MGSLGAENLKDNGSYHIFVHDHLGPDEYSGESLNVDYTNTFSPLLSNSTEVLGNTTSNSSAIVLPHTTVEIIVVSIIVTALAVFTAVGNVLVIVAFRMDKRLQTVSNYFLLSLAVADFAIGIISMPLYTVYLLMGFWPLGPYLCDLWLSLDYTMSNASVANLLIISFDRYFSITRPLTYRAKRTPKRAGIMIGMAWFVSMMLWTPWIYAWPYIEGKRTVPDTDCYIQFLKTNEYITIVTAIAAFFLPVTIMSGLYLRIYRETRIRHKEFAKLQASRPSNYSKKSMSSDDEYYSNAVVRGIDSSPDVEDVEDFPEIVRPNRSLCMKLIQCCKIDRDPDVTEESSSSDPNACQTPDSNMSHTNSLHKRRGGFLNAKESRENSSNNLMIPLLPIDSKPNSPTTLTPCTELTSASSPRSTPDGVCGGDYEQETKSNSGKKGEGMYTVLIRFPQPDSFDSEDDKPTIKMFSDSEDEESIGNTRARSDSDSDDERLSSKTDNKKYTKVARVPPLPPPSGTPALARRIQCTDQVRAAMQAKLAAKVANKMRKQKRRERKQEQKAAKTLSAILLAFIVTWTPYNIFTVVGAFSPTTINPTLYAIGYWLCYINSTINPLCYAMCNANFRRTFWKILSCGWLKHEHQRGTSQYGANFDMR